MMIGERLKRARTASGLSMQALADQVGVSANMIKKYEHGKSIPRSSILLELARALDVRAEYFFRPARVGLTSLNFRKKSNTPKKLLRKVEADALDQAERWMELMDIWPNFPLKRFVVPRGFPEFISCGEDIEGATIFLRQYWRLGTGPIANLADALEHNGILVPTSSIDSETKLDGLQSKVDDWPVIVVSNQWTGDRQRLTLAHELGHLLLKDKLRKQLNEERACNRFAAAFLLPAEELTRRLGARRSQIEMQELYLLKQEFGLSMQAIVYRLGELGIVGKSLEQRILQTFSKNGWKKTEPGEPCSSESNRYFDLLVCRALAEDIIGESKAAELLQIPLYKFHKRREFL